MAVSLEALKRLFPYPAGGQLAQTIEGLAESADDAKAFLKAVGAEAIPASATETTMDLWLEALGLSVPADATVAQKRDAVVAAYTAVGGQSLGYLEGKVQDRFPDVDVIETGAFTYRLDGFYPFARDFLYLLSMVQRLFPAHLTASYNVRSVYDGDVARCRIGTVGRAICGRGETAYTPTEATVGRAGVGRTGLAITARTAA